MAALASRAPVLGLGGHTGTAQNVSAARGRGYHTPRDAYST